MTREEKTIQVRVIVVPERDGIYYAQCLEFDLGAQAKSLPELKVAFVRALMRHVVLSLKRNEEPFSALGKAPQRYFDALGRLSFYWLLAGSSACLEFPTGGVMFANGL